MRTTLLIASRIFRPSYGPVGRHWLLAVASRRILFLLIQIQLGTHPVTPADKRRACNQIFEQTSG